MKSSNNFLQTLAAKAFALFFLFVFTSLANSQQEFDWSDPKRKVVIERKFSDVLNAIATYHGLASVAQSVTSSWESIHYINPQNEIKVDTEDAIYKYKFSLPNGPHRAPTEVSTMVIWKRNGKEHTFSYNIWNGTPIKQFSKEIKEILLPTQAAAEERDKKLTQELSKIKGGPFQLQGVANVCGKFNLIGFLQSSKGKKNNNLEAHQINVVASANRILNSIKTNPSVKSPEQIEDYLSALGYMSLIGCYKQDLEEAKYWNEIADTYGSYSASHNLGWMYQNGFGVEKDEVKAATLYKKVIDADGLSPSVKKVTRENYALLSPDAIAKANATETQAVASAAPILSAAPPQPPATLTTKPVETATAPTVASPKPAAERTQVAMSTAKRRALVIGNDTYRLIPKLVNAREDAKALSESLTSVGYQVTLKLDLTEKEMKAALRTFAAQVEGGDEVVVFFAGHGVQIGSANFLLPVDIGGDNEAQVKDEAIQLQRILDDMTERKARFTLAMIDACRDNPFKGTGRSIGGRGLASTTAATGQMVIFSAGAGQQALDKLGPADKNRNGLFTRIFLKEMQKPGLSVDKVVRNVRAEVVELAKSVGHEQVPAIYDQVVGEFYFKK